VRKNEINEQCGKFMITGGRCERKDGHEGKHRKTYTDGEYTWDDEGTTREAEQWASRFD
jgi:hypothetical protein